jgi:MFS family permease
VAARDELALDLRDERAEIGRVGAGVHLRDEEDAHGGSVCSTRLQVSRRAANPWFILAFAVAAQFGVSVVDQGLPVLTGFIKTDLGLSAALTGLAVSSLAFGKIFGSYAAGVAADRLGERRVIVAGGVAVGALAACAAAVPGSLVFVLLFCAGLAGATSTPAGGRLVLLAFPRNRRGLALSIRQCGIPAGALAAAALLPWIAHSWGWRSALAVGGGITIVTMLPLASSPVERSYEVDARSSERLGHPARDRNIRLLTMWACLVVTGQYAILAFLPLDLHRRAGLSLTSASLLVALANATGILGRVVWGTVSDRALSRGRKPLLVLLNVAGLLAAVALFVTPSSASVLVFAAVAAFAGFALIGYQGLWITLVAETAGPRRVGAATGFAVTFVQTAIAVTPPLYGLVADVSHTYRAIWAVLACVLALALVPALLVREE